MRIFTYIGLLLLTFSCNQKMNNIDEQYQFLLHNEGFKEKENLLKQFKDTLEYRRDNGADFPEFQFLNNKEKVKVNNVVFINKDASKAVFLVMGIGLDNSGNEFGSAYVFSARKANDKWVFGRKTDMTLDYFTHSYEGNLNMDKVSELSIKRMIKAGYMINGNNINYDYIDENWGYLFYK